MEKKYAVIRDTEYYQGDSQHPEGWGVAIATICDESGEETCIGTLDECQAWEERLADESVYLSGNQAGYSYRVVEVIDDSANYQDWLDSVDWEGCPEGQDYSADCRWAEECAYDTGGYLYVDNPAVYNGLIIDLGEIKK